MTEQETRAVKVRRKGIYLLPNLFTTGGLFAGFYGVIASMNGQFEAAAIAVFIAMVMDGIDGRLARMTNTQSAFGAEYDSMADMVSFGIAPSLIAYNWALSGLGKFGWLAAFIFAAGAALRLARFNTQVGTADKRYFQGLPSPSAAAIVAGLVWVGADWKWEPSNWSLIAAFVTIAGGVLMVSNFRYYSFKELNFKGKVPFMAILVLVLILVLVAFDPPIVLFSSFALYGMSGPILTLMRLREMRQSRKSAARDSDNDADSEAEPLERDEDHKI